MILYQAYLLCRYAKDLIRETIVRNASPVRVEQGGREKGGIGGSSSSLNSSASDESNRLPQQQQHASLRTSLLHSSSTNDASIGEYKYTVTVGPHSLKITGSNLDLVRVRVKNIMKIDKMRASFVTQSVLFTFYSNQVEN